MSKIGTKFICVIKCYEAVRLLRKKKPRKKLNVGWKSATR